MDGNEMKRSEAAGKRNEKGLRPRHIFIRHAGLSGRTGRPIPNDTAGAGGARMVDEVWAIGDLHADSLCARRWVAHTRLVRNLQLPAPHWEWANPAAALIFMGDYIDKGPHARTTLDFVSALTERFPTRVTALMGNHELNLLLDRAKAGADGGQRYLEYAYAAAHPSQYLQWLREEHSGHNALPVYMRVPHSNRLSSRIRQSHSSEAMQYYARIDIPYYPRIDTRTGRRFYLR